MWKGLITPPTFLDVPGYRKESKNTYNDVFESQIMPQDDVLLFKISKALESAHKTKNHEMIRIWGNQQAFLNRRFRWKNLQKQVAGREHVSTLV